MNTNENKNDVIDMLAKWDSGESIWSVELGGLGPGYEQCIQVAAIEMARDNHSTSLPDDKEQANAEWDRLCTETLRKHDAALGGMSGAQYGQASWLAYQWCHNGGPDRLIERAKEQGADTILVSNAWPRVGAA